MAARKTAKRAPGAQGSDGAAAKHARGARSSTKAGARRARAAATASAGPRYGRTEDMIRLVLALAGTRTGFTLEQMRGLFDPPLERRTMERMRDRVVALYSSAAKSTFVDGEKYWWLENPPLATVMLLPEARELAALDVAAKQLAREGRSDHADALLSLGAKVRAAIEPRTKARL